MPSRNKNKKVIPHNELSKDAKASMLKRVLYGIGMAAIVIPCLFLGGYFYLILVCLIIAAATYEMSKVPGKHFSIFVLIVTFVIMYSLVFWIMLKTSMKEEWKNFDINTSFNTIWLSPFALAVMLGLYFIVVIVKPDFVVTDAFYLSATTVLLALGFQGILYLRYIPFKLFGNISGFLLDTTSFKYFQSSLLIFYLLIAICFNDMGAYFIGVLFGKHKMNPRISPKKTWEGFVGGIIISILFSSMFAFVCAHFNYYVIPVFNLKTWWWILLCSLALPLFGNLGDFAFSAIKREYNVKDYSHILGPHGGVLDRIDSALFGGLTLAILVEFINNNWSFIQ